MEKTSGKDGLNIDRSKSLFGTHMLALLWKRLLTFKRDKKMWVFSIVMPAIFISLGIVILEATSTSSEPAILLTPTVSAAMTVCLWVSTNVFTYIDIVAIIHLELSR